MLGREPYSGDFEGYLRVTGGASRCPGSSPIQVKRLKPPGRWHHVTCKRKGNQIIQTVDGERHAVTKATGAITVTTRIRIGSHVYGGDWYRGVLDEVSYSIG